jgi:hypothetical protein
VFALGAVMQDLQNDINSSPDPYQTGIGYGRRFCIWMGAAVAFAPGGGGDGRGGGSGPGGSEPGSSSPSGPSCRASGPPPVVRGGPMRLANANQWLPQFTRASCGGNCGYVVLAVDNALGGRGIVPPPPESAMGGRITTSILEMLYGRQFGPTTSLPQYIEAQLAQGGPNALGILLAWGPTQSGGHVLNIARYQGQGLLLDGQIGQTISWQQMQSQGFTWFQLLPTYP